MCLCVRWRFGFSRSLFLGRTEQSYREKGDQEGAKRKPAGFGIRFMACFRQRLQERYIKDMQDLQSYQLGGYICYYFPQVILKEATGGF